MRPIPVLGALLLWAAMPLPAQSPAHWLDPGARVRVTTPSRVPRRVTGDVAAMLADTLVLARPDSTRVALPYLSIDIIEVSRGRDRRRAAWRGTLLGALVGVGIGGISGALGSQDLPTDLPASAALGAAGGGLLGAGAGAGLGAIFAPELWQPYRFTHAAAAFPPPPPVGPSGGKNPADFRL